MVGEKDTKKVMLDFYVVNADLGKEYTVKAENQRGRAFVRHLATLLHRGSTNG